MDCEIITSSLKVLAQLVSKIPRGVSSTPVRLTSVLDQSSGYPLSDEVRVRRVLLKQMSLQSSSQDPHLFPFSLRNLRELNFIQYADKLWV